MSIIKRMLSGSFWSAAGGAANKAAGMVSAIVIARMLGAEKFGEFGIVRSTLLTLLIFGSVSVASTATKYIAQNRQLKADAFNHLMRNLTSLAYIVAIGLTTIHFFGAQLIATYLLAMPSLASSLQLGAIYIFFSAICYFQSGIMAGFESFKFMAAVNIFNGFAVLLLLILGAYLAGLQGILLGLGLSAILTFILGVYLQKKIVLAANPTIAYADSSTKIPARELIKYCIPITLSGILVAPVNWACNAMLVRANGLSEVGIFEAANQWRMLILFIPSLLGQVSFSIFSSTVNKHDFKSAFKFNLISISAIAGAMALIMIYFAEYLMAIYGNQFASGENAMKWLCASGVIIAINITISQAIASQGNVWHSFFMNILWALATLTLSWYLVAKGKGAEGLAIAQCIAYGLHTLMQIAYLYLIMLAKPKRAAI